MRVQAARCTARGLYGAIPFRKASFVIEARDAFGNACRRGGQAFTVTIAPKGHGHYGAVHTVRDEDTGEFEVEYSVKVSGQ